jgi:hypothetical protein
MKPTFMPLVIILAGTASMARLAISLIERQAYKPALTHLVIIWATALVVATPYYILVARHLADYFVYAAFGSTSNVWKPKLSAAETILYYLTGEGGGTLGSSWVLAGTLVPLVWAWAYLRGNTPLALRGVGLAVVALMGYIVVTALGIKSPFLGMIVPAFVVTLFALTLAYVLSNLTRGGHERVARTLALSALAFAIFVRQSPWIALHGRTYPPEMPLARRAMMDKVIEFFGQIPGADKRTVHFLNVSQHMNDTSLSFYLMARGLPVPLVTESYMSDNIEDFQAALDKAHYAILIDSRQRIQSLPVEKIFSQLQGMVGFRGDFHETRSISEIDGSGNVRVFARNTELSRVP